MERESDWQIDINVTRWGALPVGVATDPGPGYGRGVKAGVGGVWPSRGRHLPGAILFVVSLLRTC